METEVAKISLEDIMRPGWVQSTTDRLLSIAHWALHKEHFPAFRRARRSIEDVVNAHLQVMREMRRRGMKHELKDELDELSARLQKHLPGEHLQFSHGNWATPSLSGALILDGHYISLALSTDKSALVAHVREPDLPREWEENIRLAVRRILDPDKALDVPIAASIEPPPIQHITAFALGLALSGRHPYFALVPDYISIVGSVARTGNGKDVDVLVRDTYERLSSGWRQRALRALTKHFSQNGVVGLHIIANPQGPHGWAGEEARIPLLDLVLVPLKMPANGPQGLEKGGEVYLDTPEAQNEPVRGVFAGGGLVMVDLGCGDNKPDGFIGVDNRSLPGVDIVADLERGIPFADNSVDLIRANHALEHIADREFIIREIWRVLKPGGYFVFATPSDKSRGAWAHPGHKSVYPIEFWAFWARPDLLEDRPRFEVVRLEERDFGNGKVDVMGILRKPLVEKGVKPGDTDWTPPKPSMAAYTEVFSVDELWRAWAGERIEAGKRLVAEPKGNGIRYIARKKGDRLHIATEDTLQDNKADRVPEIAQVLAKVGEDFVLDCDLGAYRGDKRLPTLFVKLTDRPQGVRLVLTSFDIPFWGEDLSGLPYLERRRRLEEFYERYLKASPHFALFPYRIVKNKEELQQALDAFGNLPGSEGLMVKEADAPYPSGKATDAWAKLKKRLELKAIVLALDKTPTGKRNPIVGVMTDSDIPWENIRELDGRRYVDLGHVTLPDDFPDVRVGDVLTLATQVVGISGTPKKPRLSLTVVEALEVDKSRKMPYADLQLLDMARRAGVLEDAVWEGEIDALLKADSEPQTRGEAAKEFWEDRWQEMFPPSGGGKFVLQHHWMGIREEDKDLDEAGLRDKGYVYHMDLRFEQDKDTLWGFTTFSHGRADLRRYAIGHDRLTEAKAGDSIQGTNKLAQPHEWLTIAHDKPYVAPPGTPGASNVSYGKLFEIDSGSYQIGVWNRHFHEIFLEGKKLKGRYIIASFPSPTKRIWTISKPSEQRPYAETHDLGKELERLKKEGHKWLVWAKPGEKPVLYDVETGQPVQKGGVYNYHILKTEDEKRFTLGIVYSPNEVDAQLDTMAPEEIEAAAWRSMENLAKGRFRIGLEHEVFEIDGSPVGVVVESYIWRGPDWEMGGARVKPGSWIMGVIWHEKVWELVKNGEITGFSMGGTGRRE